MGNKNNIGYCCLRHLVLHDVIYVFPFCQECIEPRESPYLFKGSYLLLYIGIFKLYIIHDPCLYSNGVCLYTCWYHYCVQVGMFDFLEVTFGSEIVEHVVCCSRAFCCYGHLGVGLYRVCDVSCLLHCSRKYILVIIFAWRDQFDPSHPPSPSKL